MQGWFNIHKSINVIHCVSKLKEKTYLIISIDEKTHRTKVCDHSKKIRLEGNRLSLMKSI